MAEMFAGLIAVAMGWLPDWAWLQALDWLFWLLYGAVILLMLAYGFVIVANLIGAPFTATWPNSPKNTSPVRK